MVFSTSPDLFVGALTGFICVIFLAIGAVAIRGVIGPTPIALRLVFLAVLLGLGGILGGAWAWSPTAYRIEGRELLIERPIGPIRIALASIQELRLMDGLPGMALKTGGNSGLFGITGNFRNQALGPFQMYARRGGDAVVLDTNGGPIVLCPDDRDGFVDTLRTAAAEDSTRDAS